MIDIDRHRLRARQVAHIRLGHAAVASQVKPQTAQRANGHAMVGGPARVGGVVHKTALAGDNFFGQVLNGGHAPLPI